MKNIILFIISIVIVIGKKNNIIENKLVKTKIEYHACGFNQNLYNNYLFDNEVKLVIAEGSPGCGKTLFACKAAVESLFHDDNIDKIVITRPVVSVENENIGFLPGDLNSKMNPWLIPIFDVLLQYFSKKELDKQISDGIIEISPLGFMRGRTFKNCFIIADEVQNTTPSQMLMMTTRIGENSKLILTGDLSQSDLLGTNGLQDILF